MREEVFLDIIKNVVGDRYIGDDCAYLKDLGVVVSQDSLVEDVHFSLKYMSPYQLGFKSAMVNISDIAASGGQAKYMTVAVSLPKNISDEFVEEFYNGINDATKRYDIKVVGGDLTSADKVMVSVTVLGVDKGRRISSRSYAQTGQVVVTSGVHGSSACGLHILNSDEEITQELKEKYIYPHVMPTAQVEFAQKIAENIKEDYAMMDSSDGLASCLLKIAQSSGKTLVVDFDKVIYEKDLENRYLKCYQNIVLYGGEDYQIVATVPESFAKEYGLHIIGRVEDKGEYFVVLENVLDETSQVDEYENFFNHFE
jgi:thiamine-monophosphate kinase